MEDPDLKQSNDKEAIAEEKAHTLTNSLTGGHVQGASAAKPVRVK